MCMVVYLGSSKPLPEIPWKKQDPDFHVTPVSTRARRQISNALNHEYVYEVGSRDGCGCAFIDEHWDDDSEDSHLIEDSRNKLFGYLSDTVSLEGSASVLLAWSGDERKQPESRVANIDEVAEMDFQDVFDRPLLINFLGQGSVDEGSNS